MEAYINNGVVRLIEENERTYGRA